MRALEAALATQWCMKEDALEQLLTIAAREHETPTPEALEAYEAKSLARTERARTRDGVAIIDMTGATFKRANLMTAMSGATSYEIIRKDFQAALDDPKIKAIMFNIDSPGGQASGVSELAAAIFAARGQKPIQAYVNGHGCSAAYWIASATDRVIANDTAILGSIGVQMALKDDSAGEEKRGVKSYRFVSSQSPMKNAGPDTEAGAEAIQTEVDALAQVFVETVARNRGVDTETVLNDFGKGGIFVGKDAVKAGLADEVGDFEGVLAALSAGRRKSSPSGSTRKGTSMSDEAPASTATEQKVDVAAAVTAGVNAALAADRTRMAGIDKIAAAHNVDAAIVASAKEDGTDVGAFALAVAELATAAAAKKGADKLEALKGDETDAAEAAASTGSEPGEKTAEALANEIIASAASASGLKE